jgi:hypothetical protein
MMGVFNKGYLPLVPSLRKEGIFLKYPLLGRGGVGVVILTE